ncbi:MAG: glutaminyl-peptide cyclotransferase [bacterium]|nr:glutaminyl-peptide cyclotransferase [bacterium]
MNRTLFSFAFAAVLLSSAFGLRCQDAQSETSSVVDRYRFEIVQTFPHDRGAFTQGLVFAREDGREIFYEGTGLRGRSTLRRVDVKTGRVLRRLKLDDKYFGEGLALVGDRLYQLTWQSNTGFIYDRRTFERLTEFSYPVEGWGLTYDPDGKRLILSDGTARLFFLDPESLTITGQVEVREGGRPLKKLNELEWIDGLVYANVWQSESIVMIDPTAGRVVGRVYLKGLLESVGVSARATDVLNGIAYDPEGRRLFVTGKLWPKVFELRLRKVVR